MEKIKNIEQEQKNLHGMANKMKDIKNINEKITVLENTRIFDKAFLKNLGENDKLYVLGHGQVSGEYIGNADFDGLHAMHLEECNENSHISKSCNNDFEELKNEYRTSSDVAKLLKGSLPNDFSNFYTLTCHSGEARRPISLEKNDLDNAAKSNHNDDGKKAYGQRFVNALYKEGFNKAKVTGYIGAVHVNPHGNYHTCKVETDDSINISIHSDLKRKTLKQEFLPENI